MKKMPEYGRLSKEFKKNKSVIDREKFIGKQYVFLFYFSYADCSLNKYMDKHNIRSNTRAFQLLTRLLTIDPTKRLTGKSPFNNWSIYHGSFYLALDAMNDPYFKEEPRPTDE